MPAELRPAATVILLRDGSSGPEVWLMERSRAVGFMASAWVFPGGRVDAADGDLDPSAAGIPRAFRVAAVRELAEEAGVDLGEGGPDVLIPWAHWITPEVEPRRYDTWFFAARLPPGGVARHDGEEAVDGGWFGISEALRRSEAGQLPVAPPTLRTLLELEPHRDVAGILAAPRRLVPICPRFLTGADGQLEVALPGDPEHPSAEAVDPPYRYAFAAGRWWAR